MRPSGRQKLHLNNNKFTQQQYYEQQLIDHKYDEQNKQMREIKSRQLLSTIMDTIEQKSNNDEQLKQSMRQFDKQLMKMYGSSQDNKNNNTNRFVSNTNKQIGNYINPQKVNTLYKTIENDVVDNVGSFNNYNNRQMRHTVSYRQNSRQSSTIRQQPQDNNNNSNTQHNISAIDNNNSKTLKQSINNNIQLPYNNKNNIKKMNNNKNFMSNKRLTVSTSVYKLQVPKPNSLTDKFMQLVLGSQQQLIQQYDRTVNPQKYQQQRKQQIIENVKKQWFKYQTVPMTNTLYQQNNYINNPNVINNTKCQLGNSNNNNNFINSSNNMNSNNISANQSRAFYDQDYYTYLKTNMKYLVQINTQQSKYNINNNSNNNRLGQTIKIKQKIQSKSLINQFNNTITRPSNYPITHSQQQKQQKQQNSNNTYQIVNPLIQPQSNTIQFPQDNNRVLLPCDPKRVIDKLKQTGGIQNTIKKMEKSLQKHQLQHLKHKQYLAIPNSNIRKQCTQNNIRRQNLQNNNNNNKLIIEQNQSSSNKNNLQSKNQSQLLKKNKPPISSFIQRQRNTQDNTKNTQPNNMITTTKSLNNSFIYKNQNQNQHKINHNYNQSFHKTNFQKQTRNNNIIEIQPINKSTWRQKSQSMRNQIHQSLSKYIN